MRTTSAGGEVRVGLFARGDSGTQVDVTIDNVQVVYRRTR
jgi:hypothetical protein